MSDHTARCCLTCARWFIPVKGVQVYCKAACRNYWVYRSPYQRNRPKRQFHSTCRQCGTRFPAKHAQVRFCSTNCQWVDHEARHPRTRPPRCVWCDRPLNIGRRFCSLQCNWNYHRTQQRDSSPINYGHCRRCGDLFIVGARRTEWCSGVCNRRDRGALRKHIARANGGEDVTLRDIAERDGWRCHLCGKRVPDQAYGARDSDPTLDHLIPVSAGGQHTALNLALAHNRCNWERREIGAAQLRLIA